MDRPHLWSREPHLEVPFSWDTWLRISQGVTFDHQVGIDRLQSIALEALRRAHPAWREDEVDFVRNDGVYRESCRAAYFDVLSRVQRTGKLPKELRLTFTRPGTRDDRENEVQP